ncbi:MAG: Gfo/Idh/MocA family oxidoreductase [Robiginitomaculum sp.]|nr:Gfo/Idh/MocA family oxidoreductase [Robiginitomaculum sp.]
MTNAFVAVVGCGYWGKNLARNFAQLGALRAIVDPDEKAAKNHATTHGVIAISMEQALADPRIKALAIAAPAELHKTLAIQGIEAGKHVFVEKPLALTVPDGEAMAASSVKHGRVLMVGHLLQYHPAFQKMLQLVHSGEFGNIRYAYSNRLSTGKFRLEENALWSLAPHDFSMLLALLDEEPTTVTGSGGAWVTEGVEDMFRVDMNFASGRKAHIFASWLHPFKEQKLVVVMETGMLVFEDSQPEPRKKLALYRHTISTTDGTPTPNKADVEYVEFNINAEPLKEECRHFVQCCIDGNKPKTDADEALRVLRALVAAG